MLEKGSSAIYGHMAKHVSILKGLVFSTRETSDEGL